MTLATLSLGDGFTLIGGVAAVLASIVLATVTAIAPEKVWRKFEAWRYEPGSAPTDAELARRRFGGIVTLVGFAILAIVAVNIYLGTKWDNEADALAERHWDITGFGICVVPDRDEIGSYPGDVDDSEDPEDSPDTPLSATGYVSVDPDAESPSYLWRKKDSCGGDGLPPLTQDLVVGVDSACEVTSVEATETATGVEVRVGGRPRVAGEYARDCSDPGIMGVALVLVDLDRPLGDRKVVDASTGSELPAAG